MTVTHDPTTNADGPGQVFAQHRVLYGLSLVAAGSTCAYAVVLAHRARGGRRIPWVALAALQAGIVVGIIRATRSAAAQSEARRALT